MSQPAISPPVPLLGRNALVPATPGAFHARCNLARHVPEKKLTPTELREAREAGYPRHYNTDLDKPRWAIAYPACSGFETDDREAYERHMVEAHSRPLSWAKGWNEAFARSVRSGWRSPRAAPEGKQLPKTVTALTRTCAGCGLVAEVWGGAGEQWWAEHERGCSLVVAS